METDPSTPPSGWYADPQGPPGQQRWWDSSSGTWGEITRAGGDASTSVDPWLLTAAAGCLAMLIGPFGPWVTALGGVVSRSGLDATGEDGWIMVALAVGCAFLVYQWYSIAKTRPGTLLLTAAAAGALGVYHYIDIVQNHSELGVGWGLYLSMAGAVAVVVTAGERALKRR